jgi:hypothetical protein
LSLLKPRNVIDYIENHHEDVFANFLSDVNLGMLNGHFHDNEFTHILLLAITHNDIIYLSVHEACVHYNVHYNLE